MAEQPIHELNEIASSCEDSSSKIDAINTKFAPGKPPLIPFMPLIMRETCPSSRKVPELDSPLEYLAMCSYNCNTACQSWQCAYLANHSNYEPAPTSLTARSNRYNPKPPVQLISAFITKKELDCEIARQKLVSLYGGNMDLETFRELFCKKEKPKESSLSPPQEEEPTPEESEKEIIETPKENPEEPQPSPVSEEKLKPPKRQPGTGITDPDHPILKNRTASLESPRIPNPYILPIINTGDVDFFPGKPRLTQRYKAEEMSRAARKIPIVEEADNRFAIKARSSV